MDRPRDRDLCVQVRSGQKCYFSWGKTFSQMATLTGTQQRHVHKRSHSLYLRTGLEGFRENHPQSMCPTKISTYMVKVQIAFYI